MSLQDDVRSVLDRRRPARLVYAPNYWQWFTHHKHHGLLPDEIRHCDTQLDVIRHLGLHVFSRNVYCDATRVWYGGLAEEVWDGVDVEIRRHSEGSDEVTEKFYHTRAGTLTEKFRYLFRDSTLVQERFLLVDPATQMDAFAAWVEGRRWRFYPDRYAPYARQVGDDGLVIAGELHCPLKMLHFSTGPSNTVFLLQDHPERCRELMAIHEEAQLDLAAQIIRAGVPAMMAMDNLDSMFHTPRYVEQFSASFYEKASRMCREGGSSFFIHACGRQRAILPLIASLGVDGLEGVAYPPLGDAELDEAMRLSGDRMILTGGISAIETEKFKTRDEVRRYVDDLFGRIEPYTHRFMFSASCNTSIRTPWEVIVWFCDAWRERQA